MKSLERYWFGEVTLARPYLLARLVLALLAFDLWINLVPEGAKYGAAAFNVPHFAWFGSFVPSATFYVGVLVFTGVLALSQAVYRPHRIALVLVAAGYTLGWSCSLLDSSPHHYLLSLYLVCLVFFPMLSARAAFSRSSHPPRGSAWAYVLFCVTSAIVYFYVAAWAAAAGEPYALPMLCCVAYLVVSMQDRTRLAGLRVAMPVLVAGPVAFHLSAPQEGWLPLYMIGSALIVFLPGPWVHGAGRLLTRPARNVVEEREHDGLDESASRVFYASLLGLVAAPMISMGVDLPGVKTGCTLTALAMLLVMGRQLYLTPRFRPVWRVGSLFVGCVALWATLTFGTTRSDYYRNAADDAERRGDREAAALYQDKAKRYAR